MVAHPGDGGGNKPPDIVKLCMDNGKDRCIVLPIGTEGVPPKEGSEMNKVEIRRVYGLYDVYVDGVFAQRFVTLYSAKEFVAKVGA